MAELVNLRSRHERHYQNKDGSITSRVAFNQCFQKDDGSWDLQENILANVDNVWQTQNKGVKYKFERNGITIIAGDLATKYQPNKLILLDTSTNTTHTIASAQLGTLEKSDASIRVSDVFPNIDLLFKLDGDNVEEQIIINKACELPDLVKLKFDPKTTLLAITYSVNNPPTVKDAEEFTGVATKLLTAEHNGKLLYKLPSGVYYDSKENPVKGRVRHIVGVADIAFGVGLPVQQLFGAVYPVIIDPSVEVTGSSGSYLVLESGSYYYGGGANIAAVGYQSTKSGYLIQRYLEAWPTTNFKTRTINAASFTMDRYLASYPLEISVVQPYDYSIPSPTAADMWSSAAREVLSTDAFAPGGSPPTEITLSLTDRFIKEKNSGKITYWYRIYNDDGVTGRVDVVYTGSSSGSTQAHMDVTYGESQTQDAVSGIGDNQVTLNWTGTGYLVAGDKQEAWYKASSSDPGTFDSATWTKFGSDFAYNATTGNVTGLTAGTKYYFIIREVQVRSSTDYSGAVSTTQNATTTGTAPAAGHIKNINSIAWANVKKINVIAVANIKKVNSVSAV